MFAALLRNLWLGRNAKVFDAPQIEDSSVIDKSTRLVSLMVQTRAACQENYRGLHPLVGHLTNLRRRAWRVKIQHGLRSGNKVVHVLATSTSVDTLESLYYTQLPDSVLQVLHEDSLRSL
ncbi:hypothetical protein V6N12_023655 [Hibiscus sabdariffa]|uniref:Uncharacterized protein n=1 Tax=Hibiscus sabdariffa TaxID=183260 RepID=A0ABR2FYP8_9ROSI